jgi:hypothetical protein
VDDVAHGAQPHDQQSLWGEWSSTVRKTRARRWHVQERRPIRDLIISVAE